MTELNRVARPTPGLSIKVRIHLCIFAVAGTVIHAASFALPGPQVLLREAIAIGIASGLAWIIFGFTLGLSRSREAVGRWFDHCLITIAIGTAILLLAAIFNVLGAAAHLRGAIVYRSVHASLLVLADLLMGGNFAMLAKSYRVSPAQAIALWVCLLNGLFVTLSLVILRGGVTWF